MSMSDKFINYKRNAHVQRLKSSLEKPSVFLCRLCDTIPTFETEESRRRHLNEKHQAEIPTNELDMQAFISEKVQGQSRRKRQGEFSRQSVSEERKKAQDQRSSGLKGYQLDQEPSTKRLAFGGGTSPEGSIASGPSASEYDKQVPEISSTTAEIVSNARSPERSVARSASFAASADFGRRAPVSSRALFDPGSSSPGRQVPTKTNHNRISQGSSNVPPSRPSIHTSNQPSDVQPPPNQRGILNISSLQARPPSRDDAPPRHIPEPSASDPPPKHRPKRQADLDEEIPEDPRLILQPVTRPISQEQLIAEVKGIYAGLVMVEGKCIQVDAKQTQLVKDAPPGQPPKLNNEQYQALIALHRTLLHEHHDFFLASQHPSATPGVRRLALKYAMPARLWKHGIHAFLELLRNRLPDSIEHMLAFIYLAYSMMTLLLETVPVFESTWIECLGDLARYRMAIVEKDPDDNFDSDLENEADESDSEERLAIRARNQDRTTRIETLPANEAKVRKTRKKRRAYNDQERETWTLVAFEWYVKASNASPEVGRLYHHLAILSQMDEIQQLFYYGKALVVPKPFEAARESILTLFRPVFGLRKWRRGALKVDKSFTTMHAVMFTRNELHRFDLELPHFIRRLDKYVKDKGDAFLDSTGFHMAIANIQGLVDYGKSTNPIVKALLEGGKNTDDVEMSNTATEEALNDARVFSMAHRLFNATAQALFSRDSKGSSLSFLHCTLVFLQRLSFAPLALAVIEPTFPWSQLATVLNWILQTQPGISYDRFLGSNMPLPSDALSRPFREDFALRQTFFSSKYYPSTFFDDKLIDREDQFKDTAKLSTAARPERCLWLGAQLARRVSSLTYDVVDKRFFVPVKKEKKTLEAEYQTETESVTLVDDDISMASVLS